MSKTFLFTADEARAGFRLDAENRFEEALSAFGVLALFYRDRGAADRLHGTVGMVQPDLGALGVEEPRAVQRTGEHEVVRFDPMDRTVPH